MTTAAPRRHAISLVEVIIAVSIFGLMMSMVGQSLVMGVKLQDNVGTASTLDDEANRVLQKIASYLRTADYNYIYPLNDPNGNVTITFSLCTGLDRNGPIINQKKLVVAYNKAARTLTSTLYDTSASTSATYDGRWPSLEQVVATNLAATNGFVVTQQGIDTTYVKGNRLTLALAMAESLRDGTTVTKTATTTLYLRSTIYFKDELLSSATVGTTTVTSNNGSGSGDVVVPGSNTNAPTLTLGPDTDNSVASNGKNNVIITIKSALQSGATTNLQSLAVSFSCADTTNTLTQTTITRNKEIKITGAVAGSVTVTVTATSKQGNTTYTTTTSRVY